MGGEGKGVEIPKIFSSLPKDMRISFSLFPSFGCVEGGGGSFPTTSLPTTYTCGKPKNKVVGSKPSNVELTIYNLCLSRFLTEEIKSITVKWVVTRPIEKKPLVLSIIISSMSKHLSKALNQMFAYIKINIIIIVLNGINMKRNEHYLLLNQAFQLNLHLIVC